MPTSRGEVFGTGDREILNELSFMFPNATQNLSDASMAFSNTSAYASGYQTQQPVMYTQENARGSSDFPDIHQPVFHANIPQHPRKPVRTRSLPTQAYSSSMPHLTPQMSPSPQSPQPQSPATPSSATTNKSMILPKSGQPQIRYNEKCFDYSIQKNKSIPLDPASFGR